jgi:tripartite-type tricarboxylate transporter receptor subunit TctC
MKRYTEIVFIILAGLAILYSTVPVNAWAKDVYPSKPINIIVPFAPGGSVDMATRTIAIYMSKYLKTSIVISNVLGASGVIGYSKCYTAKPDGYTLMSWYTLPPFVQEFRKRKPVYKTMEFVPIAALLSDIPMLVVHPEGTKNFADFVKQARVQNVTIGCNGRDSINGLQGLMMAEELGLKISWVNFSGAGESLATLAGKHIDAAMAMTGSAMPLIKGGKIFPLIMFADKRGIKFPTVPVPGEMGFNVPFVDSLLGIVGPPGLDKKKVKILEAAVMKSAKDPGYMTWQDKVSTTEATLMSADNYWKAMEKTGRMTEQYKRFLPE